MIVPVGSWVLKQACRQAVAWHRLGHELTMAINVSMRQLEAEDFVDQLRDVLSAARLEPTHSSSTSPSQALVNATEARLTKIPGAKAARRARGRGRLSRRLHSPTSPGLRSTPSRSTRPLWPPWPDSPEAIAPSTGFAVVPDLGIATLAEGIEQGWQLATLQKEQCQLRSRVLVLAPDRPEALEAVLSLEPLFS